MKSKKAQTGDVISIEYDPGIFAFGRVIAEGFIEFYDLRLTNEPPADMADQLKKAKALFAVAVHKSWMTNDKWQIIGKNKEDIPGLPLQFKQKINDPNDLSIIDPVNGTRKATFSEVEGLERLAVWEDNHVEDRLRDHFNGKRNVWVEQLKPKRPS